MSAIDYLCGLRACEGPHSAMEWVRSRPPKRQTLRALWADCPRGDWMLWLAGRVANPDLDGIVAAAHACAMLAHDYAAAAAAYAADADAAAAAAAAAAYAYAAADARDICHLQCADLVRLLVRCPEEP